MPIMKKFIIIILVLLSVKDLRAQTVTTLIVNARPTDVLSEWAYRKDIVSYIVQADSVDMQVKIKTEIKTVDGTTIAYTDLNRSNTYTLQSGTTVFTAVDVLPLEFMVFTGSYKNSLDKTGKLPADNYQLCVQLVRSTDMSPASDVECKNFFVASVQLPVLMMPADETSLDIEKAQTAITFRWTPVTPLQSSIVTYRLQVFEILENQQKLQALRGNQPLLDIDLRAQTQYIWRPGLSFSTEDLPKKFIWTIQTLDANNEPLVQTGGNGESRSEPLIFYVDKTLDKKIAIFHNNLTSDVPSAKSGVNYDLSKDTSTDPIFYHPLRREYSGKPTEVNDMIYLQINNNNPAGSGELTYTIQNSLNYKTSPEIKLDIKNNQGLYKTSEGTKLDIKNNQGLNKTSEGTKLDIKNNQGLYKTSEGTKLDIKNNQGSIRIAVPIQNSVVEKGETGILTVYHNKKIYHFNFKRIDRITNASQK